jgi:hypothetical protein
MERVVRDVREPIGARPQVFEEFQGFLQKYGDLR